jgi:GTPase Era involved in 16S rRNA processing
VRDWTGDAVGPVSEIPHETRRARRKEDITITGSNGNAITIDIVDTPGVTTKIDYHEFLEYGLEKEEAIKRAREATEGVAEAMHWLREDIDGVIYMLDSTQDPFMQVNIMMIGIIESRKLPVIIVANKIDLPDAMPQRIKAAFPQHPVVQISSLDGSNVEQLYETIAESFG